MKLRHKITIIVSLTSLTLAVVLISIFTFWSNYEIETKTSESFTLTSNLISKQIDSYLSLRFSELSRIRYTTTKNIKNIALLKQEFTNFRNDFKTFQSIQLYTADGIKLIDTNRIGVNKLYDIEDIKKQLQNKDTSFFYHKDSDLNTPLYSFITKIYDNNFVPSGYIVANIPYNGITNIVRSIVKNDNLENFNQIELIRKDGQILYSNYRKTELDSEILKKLYQEYSSSEQNFHFKQDKISFYSVFRSEKSDTMLEEGWFLTVRLFKKDALKPIRDRAIILSLITLIITTCFAILAYQLILNITRPVEEAANAVKEIGLGNFSTLSEVKTSDDEIGKLVVTIQDLGVKLDHLIKDQALKYRMASLGKMAGSIAHEINNPLHLINNHAIILNKVLVKNGFHLNETSDIERAQRSLKSITDTVHRISHIIAGMKALSRDGAKDPYQKVKISELVDGVLTLCFESLKNKEIEFNIETPIEDSIVECRSVQIQQVLLNLINNAADAIKLDSTKWIKLKIAIDEIDQSVRFEIKNSGPKISDDIANNLFTPFYTTKAEGQGTGLGLSISRSIVMSHKGDITLDMSTEHTTFVVKIPTFEESEATEISSKIAA